MKDSRLLICISLEVGYQDRPAFSCNGDMTCRTVVGSVSGEGSILGGVELSRGYLKYVSSNRLPRYAQFLWTPRPMESPARSI